MTTSILDIADHAELLYSTKQNGRPVSIYLEGPPGCGKSQVLETLMAQNLEDAFWPDAEPMAHHSRPNMHWSRCGKVCVITEILSTVESIDVRGASIPHKDKETGEWAMAWLMPSLVKSEQLAYQHGAEIVILLFDELAQCESSTQKAVVDILLNGRIGEHGLRPTTWTIGAGNRLSDGAGAGRLLSIMRNRMVNYSVHMPLDRWRGWAKSNGTPEVVLDFLEFRPDLLADCQPSKDGPFLTYRSMSQAVAFVNQAKSMAGDTDPMTIPQNSFLKQTVAGVIGEPAQIELFAYAADAAALPKFHEVVRDPMGAKCPPMSNISAQFAASQMIIKGVDATNIDKCWTYAQRLLKEMQVRNANEMLSNMLGGVLFDSPIFTKWLAENKSLVASSWA